MSSRGVHCLLSRDPTDFVHMTLSGPALVPFVCWFDEESEEISLISFPVSVVFLDLDWLNSFRFR